MEKHNKINQMLDVLNLSEILDEKQVKNIYIALHNLEYSLKLLDYDSTLEIEFFGDLTDKQETYILPLYRLVCLYFKKSNIRKIEFKISLKQEKIILKLIEMTIKNNFPGYIATFKDKEITIDFLYKFYAYIDFEILLRQLEKLNARDLITLNVSNYNKKNFGAFNEYNCDNKIKTNKNRAIIREAEKEIPTNFDLEELPFTQNDLANFTKRHIKTDGEIFSLEVKDIKDKKMYVLDITNYKSSLSVKVFASSSLDFKVGDIVVCQGVLVYDDFRQNVILQVKEENIKKVEGQSFKKDMTLDDVFDNKTDKRTELACHTSFSTQDGMTSVEDYLKTCDHFGIKSLAITDNENIQAYPDLFNLCNKYNIKPIYGVSMNVINKEEYKIFYKGNHSNNTIIGLDIETTGFSSLYDDIIEISAYKIINGDRHEYSCLVKPTSLDKMTDKIVDLTGITTEMLDKDGIDIKDALKGLYEFIDGGIIVAHNATFDVYFLEQKMKEYLGLDLNFSFIDTLNLARAIMPPMRSFSLDKVCTKLKVKLEAHHRAIYDAIACLDIYYALVKNLENITDFELDDIQDRNVIIKTKILGKKKNEDFINFLKNQENLTFEYENLSENEQRINNFYIINLKKSHYLNVINYMEENKIKITEKYIATKNSLEEPETLNLLIKKDDYVRYGRFTKLSILVKNQKGLKELYKLISKSNIEGIGPRGNVVFTEDLEKKDLRENVLIGSGTLNGLFGKIYNNGLNTVNRKWFNLIDYLEFAPLDSYVSILERDEKNTIKQTILNMILYAESLNLLVVAHSDAFYINPEMKSYRNVFANTLQVGGVSHYLKGKRDIGLNVMLSTNSLIKKIKNDYDFSLPQVKKYIFKNPDNISDKIENEIKVIPDKLYTPTDDFLKDKILDIVGYKVPSVLEEFKKIVYESAKKYEINGQLPEYIEKRLKKEMDSIIGHGFYIIYYIAYLLVKKSNSDGYVVGSRGSVGSSFVAFLMGITEVNALKPHYICEHCHYQAYKSEPKLFDTVNDEIIYNNLNLVSDGFDLEKEICPICGKPLKSDGHDIPFETFLGFNGDKTPDIDLNFSGDYQWKAHNFCKEVFGEDHAFRAGTIGTVAEKTAIEYLNKYYSSIGEKINPIEIKRRSHFLTDVKRTTGQHPGGIIIIPANMEIYDFTPIQYPANKEQDWFTTHLDYNAIHENVLKMDILGHDDPTILKFLMENVQENPSDYPFDSPKEIPINDKKIINYLKKNEKGEVESLGIPELGTNFVKKMLEKIEPESFYELVKVSGLSHGENVWEKNAECLTSGTTEYGIINFKDTIGCRDDIMVQLLQNGLEPKMAFDIMEFVRKGKVHKDPEKWAIFKKEMQSKKVPEWYIWSLAQIKYMFPKAHAVAYVMSALRIAWFKAYKPLDFYQAFFTIRADVFDAKTIATNDIDYITSKMNSINQNKNATKVEKDSVTYLEVAVEMLKRGLRFQKPNLKYSHKTKFLKADEKTLLMPFRVLDGVGEKTASLVYENRKNDFYKDVEDLKKRGKADKKFLESLADLNALNF